MVATRIMDPQMAGAGQQRYHLVVGVDFGTTYSGVSFSLSKDNDASQIRDYTEWPSNIKTGHTKTALKTPSRIAYAEENNLAKNRWGYQVDAGLKQYSWMKLHLDKNAEPSVYDDPDLSEEIKNGILALQHDRSAEEITSDYLKELYTHLMEFLEKRYRKEVLQVTTIKFWLTKPAIWSDEAEAKTLQAAKKAGFGTRPGDEICLILEPEAAALATITGLSRDYDTAVKPGDSIIVCDCGGGTVDLTGYIVAEKNDQFVLHETCPALGGKCGGSAVDRNFRKWMSKQYRDSFDSLTDEFTGPGSQFMQAFEWNKRQFGAGDDFSYMEVAMDDVDFDDKFYTPEDGFLPTEEVMKDLFDPVVERIKELVQTQIDRVSALRKEPVNKLFLVGGFGDSAYLRKQLEAYLAVQEISVHVPGSKNWGAVAKGAVVRGLEMAAIDTRRCRTSYGTIVSRPFREGIDLEENSYIDAFDGKQADGYMAWCVMKGAEITSETSISLTFMKTIWLGTPDEKAMRLELLYCDDDDPPERVGPSVKKLGVIETDLGDVDLRKFDSARGGEVVNLVFQIEVLLSDKQGTIRFECMVEDEVVGNAEINFTEHGKS